MVASSCVTTIAFTDPERPCFNSTYFGKCGKTSSPTCHSKQHCDHVNSAWGCASQTTHDGRSNSSKTNESVHIKEATWLAWWDHFVLCRTQVANHTSSMHARPCGELGSRLAPLGRDRMGGERRVSDERGAGQERKHGKDEICVKGNGGRVGGESVTTFTKPAKKAGNQR